MTRQNSKKFVELHNEAEEADGDLIQFYKDFFDDYSYCSGYDEEDLQERCELADSKYEEWQKFVDSIKVKGEQRGKDTLQSSQRD